MVALQINARATFGVVAAALGEQERTVARRAERLLETGAVRLTAFTDELRTGRGQPVALRIEVDSGATDEVAGRLCQRSDTRAVMAVTGDADIGCELVAADRPTLHRVLSRELPAIPGIRSTSSYMVLRHVKPTSDWRQHLLSKDQCDLVRGCAPRLTDAPVPELSDTDVTLAGLLRENARMSYTELAERLQVTSTTARRRLDRLLDSGLVSLLASVEPRLVGLPFEADVWVDVRPADTEKVAIRLAARPEVTYCGVLAGGYAVEVLLALAEPADLYAFSAEVFGREPAVRRCEPTVVTHTYKRGYLVSDQHP